MWSTTSIFLALVASANAMVDYGDMIARRTITPAPQPTDASIVELERRDNSISLEGYTSEFGTWTPVYCNSGSTFKTFSTVSWTDVWAACCPEGTTCNFNYQCDLERAEKWNGDVESCTDTCDTGYIYRSMNDPTPMIMPGCWQSFSLYRHPNGPIAGGSSPSTITDGSSPSSLGSSSPSSNATTTTASKSGNSSHSTLIAVIAAVAGVVLLAVLGALIAYICVLRRRTKNIDNINSPNQTAAASSTELHKLEPTPPTAPVTPLAPQPWQGKVELPTDFAGYNAYEMPSSPAVSHAKMYGAPPQQSGPGYFQQPLHPNQGAWSPHTPAEPYPYSPQQGQHHTPGVSPVIGSAVPLEMPARASGRWGAYQELPG